MLRKFLFYEALKQAQEKLDKRMKIDVCRMCMASNVKMVGIFDCVNRNLAEDIQFCTGIHIQKTDDLTKKICYGCLTQLKTAFLFKSKCLRTERELNNLSSSELNRIQVKKEVRTQEKVTFMPNQEKQEKVTIPAPTVQRENKVLFLQPQEKQEKALNFSSLLEQKPAIGKLLKPQEKQEISTSLSAEETLKNMCKRERTKMSEDEINEKEDFFDDWTSSHEDPPLETKLNPLPGQSMFHDVMTMAKRRLDAKMKLKSKDKCICELCGKQLANHLTLRGHMMSHQPPNMFCAHCDYKTHSRSDLSKHLKLHTEEKRYRCGYCAKMFHMSSNLYVHIRRMHEKDGLKKFKCTICESEYTSGSSLKRHTLSHLNARNFECGMCSSRFNNLKYLRRHLKNLHNVILPKQKKGRPRNSEFDNKSEDPSSTPYVVVLQNK